MSRPPLGAVVSTTRIGFSVDTGEEMLCENDWVGTTNVAKASIEENAPFIAARITSSPSEHETKIYRD